ncbi:MAG: T9SS type A sorting domain-containing protein [bacterium]|nr:T9SS type A sorting domain-containing protein [Candidatus Kapabacteria bacterium]
MTHRSIIAIALIVASIPTVSIAQTEFFTALDARAIARIKRDMRDSLAADARLISVESDFVDHTSGASPSWTYTFYSPSRVAIRSAFVQRTADTFQVRMLGLTNRSSSLPAIDTSLTYAPSNRMVEMLVRNDHYLEYRSRHFDNPMEFVQLDRLGEVQLTLPGSFPTDPHVWQVQFERVGDSTMMCVIAPRTGQTHCETFFDTTAEFQTKSSVASAVEFYASNFGVFGQNDQSPGFVYPRGSGLSYIFGAGFWFAAKMPGGVKNVSMSYDPYGNFGSMWPGDASLSQPFPSHADLYHSDEYDQSIGIKVGQPSELRWPLWHVVDNTATYVAPGRYLTHDVERVFADIRPAFVETTEQFVTRYRDDEQLSLLQTTPIGLQVEEHIYAPLVGRAAGTVYVQYQIINKSGAQLSDCAVAGIADFDIGDAANDVATFYHRRPELRTATGASLPETEIGYGALAITQIEAPIAGANGFVDNSLRERYQDLGRVATYRSWKIEDELPSAAEYYDIMIAGTIDADSVYEDSRVMLASSTFHMAPGDTAWYTIAYTVYPDRTHIVDGDADFEVDIERIIDEYYHLTPLAAPDERWSISSRGDLSVAIYPHPVASSTRVAFDVGSYGETLVQIVDALGRISASYDLGSLPAGHHVRTIDVSHLSNGVYSLVVTASGARGATSMVVAR